MSVKLCI